jgi:hypothetical protein
MYTIKRITPDTSIGNSVADLNANYAAIDLWTQTIAASATFFWEPLVELYTYISPKWEQAISIVQKNSAEWIDFATTVRANSSYWIEPSSITYPTILPKTSASNVEYLKKTALTWLTNHFPISSENTIKPFHLQNKIYYVTFLFNTSENNDKMHYKHVYRECNVVSSRTLQLQCLTKYSGMAYCSNGNLDCSNYVTRCGIGARLECYFLSRAGGQGVYESNNPNDGLGGIKISNESDPGELVNQIDLDWNSKNNSSFVARIASYTDEALADYDFKSDIFLPDSEGGGTATYYHVPGGVALGSLHGLYYKKYTNTYEDSDTAFKVLKFQVSNCGWQFVDIVGNEAKVVSTIEIKPPPIAFPDGYRKTSRAIPVPAKDLVQSGTIYLPRMGSRGVLPEGINPANVYSESYMRIDSEVRAKFINRNWTASTGSPGGVGNKWVGGYATWNHADNDGKPFEEQYGIWVVPAGVYAIKIAVVGTGGLAGAVDSFAQTGGLTGGGLFNIQPAGLVINGEYVLGQPGGSVPSAYKPGLGRAGAGAAGGYIKGDPRRWFKGPGSGGGPAWGYYTMEVSPGLKFKYSMARPNSSGIINPADSWFWGGPENLGFFSDNWGGMLSQCGKNGDPVGQTYDAVPQNGQGGEFVGKLPGSPPSATMVKPGQIQPVANRFNPGQDGALGYDKDGNPAAAAGFIAIDFIPAVTPS